MWKTPHNIFLEQIKTRDSSKTEIQDHGHQSYFSNKQMCFNVVSTARKRGCEAPLSLGCRRDSRGLRGAWVTWKAIDLGKPFSQPLFFFTPKI
jgi:hypothetical protein